MRSCSQLDVSSRGHTHLPQVSDQADVLPRVPPIPPAVLGTVTHPWGQCVYFGAAVAPPSAGTLGAEGLLRLQNLRLVSFYTTFSNPFGQAIELLPAGVLLGVLTASACKGWGKWK